MWSEAEGVTTRERGGAAPLQVRPTLAAATRHTCGHGWRHGAEHAIDTCTQHAGCAPRAQCAHRTQGRAWGGLSPLCVRLRVIGVLVCLEACMLSVLWGVCAAGWGSELKAVTVYLESTWSAICSQRTRSGREAIKETLSRQAAAQSVRGRKEQGRALWMDGTHLPKGQDPKQLHARPRKRTRRVVAVRFCAFVDSTAAQQRAPWRPSTRCSC